ncbi:unnamed protein product, partial [Cuscuta epithymum]
MSFILNSNEYTVKRNENTQKQKDQAKVTALGAQVWRLPKPGWCKMNVDAARDHTGSWFGWAVHNSSGDFVGGGIKSGRGSCSSLEADLLSIREALSWIKDQGWDFVEVESDAL